MNDVTADSGYCSEKKLRYLKENGINSYIKLQDHEKRRTRAYAQDIGKCYNMTVKVHEDEHYYICNDRRELHYIRNEKIRIPQKTSVRNTCFLWDSYFLTK